MTDSDDALRLIHALVDAVNRNDRDAWVALFHPDFEGRSALLEMDDPRLLRGLEGAGAWFDNLEEAYERLQAWHDQTITVGPHQLHLVRVEYVGKGSGVTIESVLAMVAESRDGRWIYAHSHLGAAGGFTEMGERLARA